MLNRTAFLCMASIHSDISLPEGYSLMRMQCLSVFPVYTAIKSGLWRGCLDLTTSEEVIEVTAAIRILAIGTGRYKHTSHGRSILHAYAHTPSQFPQAQSRTARQAGLRGCWRAVYTLQHGGFRNQRLLSLVQAQAYGGHSPYGGILRQSYSLCSIVQNPRVLC